MNQHIEDFNNGRSHQPIIRVRVSEPKGEKYNIGSTGINRKKFVEAQSGTNLYFAIYEDEQGKRSYQTVPLNEAVERLKQGWTPVPEIDENNNKLKFYLSPNDLVYIPTEEEQLKLTPIIDKKRIYKFVSATGQRAFFLPHSIASVLQNKVEYNALNKIEVDFGVTIKTVCWKLEVDRLGNIINIIR